MPVSAADRLVAEADTAVAPNPMHGITQERDPNGIMCQGKMLPSSLAHTQPYLAAGRFRAILRP